MDIVFSPSFVCLNYLESISPSSVCLNFSGIAIILFSCVLAWLKFAVIVTFVFRPGLKLPCLSQFLFSFLVDTVPFRSSRRAISFLVLFGVLRFVGT